MEAGTIRVLAISSAERLPGVAARTLREQGVDVEFENWRSVLAPPFSNNAGRVTAILAQYRAPPGKDGHYVVFDIAAASRQASEFLGTLARTGTATVVAP